MLRSTIGKISRSLSQGITSVSVPAAPFARVVHQHDPLEYRGRREDRVAAAPGALAQKKFARARKPQVQAVITPAFPARWCYGLYAISSVNHSVCHRRRPRYASIVANLTPDIGAPGPRDFAVRVKAARQSAPPRPPHPRLTSRDDRDTPLRKPRRDGDTIHLILHFGKTKYFLAPALTEFVRPRPSGKSVPRHRLRKKSRHHVEEGGTPVIGENPDPDVSDRNQQFMSRVRQSSRIKNQIEHPTSVQDLRARIHFVKENFDSISGSFSR
jgi:hypothetical protein